jgi:flagellar hook-associated protein 3 FlgL
MRISSNTMFNTNVAALNQQQALLAQTQQQISTGSKLLSAATDPVAYTRALDVTQADAMNTQQAANRAAATGPLALAETALSGTGGNAGVTALLQDIRTTAVAAGGAGVSNANRAAMAATMSGQLQQLIGLANSSDGSGNYLFAGFQSKSPPFAMAATGVVSYNGDSGQQLMQVSPGRQMAVSDNGADVFMRIKNGNGTFNTQAAATNTGGGIISAGLVTNPAQLTANTYTITFPTATTYAVAPAPTVGAAGGAFAPGQAIAFDGMQFNIQGQPNAGVDSFTVAPSANQSVFTTITNLINTLNTPVSGANLSNGLLNGITNLDNSLNHILNVVASEGSRQNELTALNTAGDSVSLQYKQTLSTLQDTNYVTAISVLNQQQTILQAAQKSFAQTANLSMFTYI